MVFSSLVFSETVKTDITVGKSKLIPPDPSESVPFLLTKPTNKINATLVKAPLLLPYVVPNHVIIKLALPDIDDVSKSQIKVFEDGREQGFVLFKEAELRKRADIAIVIDTTGSMNDAIYGVRNSVIKFAEILAQSGLDVMIGVVPYDDRVNPPLIGISPGYLNLSTPVEARDYVAKITRTDGGSEVAYNAILFAVQNMNWRPASQKIIIIVTDEFDNYGGTAGYVSKTDLIRILGKEFTVHGVFITGNDYSTGVTDFSNPRDVRQVVVETGGSIIYTGRHGDVDLANKVLIEQTASSWLLVFESDSPKQLHTIEIFYKNNDDERYVKLENVDYVTGKEVKTGK